MSTSRLTRSLLIHGSAGSWKTAFMAWANLDPRIGPLLLLDFEGNAISIQGSGTVTVKINSAEDLNEQYEWLRVGGEFEIFNCDTEQIETVDYSKFKTVAIDSGSELQTGLLLGRGEDRAAEMLKANKLNRADPAVLEEADYGNVLIQLRRTFRLFKNTLSRNFFITSLSKTALVAGEGMVRMPAFAGQMAEEIVGQFDICAFMAPVKTIGKKDAEKPGDEKKDSKNIVGDRIMVLNNYQGVRARTHAPALPWIKDKVVVPNYFTFGENDNPATMLYDFLKVKKEEQNA